MSGRQGGIMALVVAVVIGLVSVYATQQVGILIGDRFTTSEALSINATLNPEGAAAQIAVNTGFYQNITFVDLAVFAVVAGLVLLGLRSFGVF
ncbi:unnamed protein product [marine sediment metagenome]|uniref:Uncharacterized protein n=1 Tax=marine sediment metagenome TaxID=412755 RepID=X0ZCG9_9ZZZZ